MKKITKILAIIAATALLSLSAGCIKDSNKTTIEKVKENGYITMATNAEFEPFEYKDGTEFLGIDIDISKKIAEKLGVELKISDVAFSAVLQELANGTCEFVAAGMSYDETRAKNADFSDPYFSASQVILVNSDSSIASADDLNGKKIGVQEGTTGADYCEEKLEAEVIPFSKHVDAVSDLIAGQIDAVVLDDFPATKFVEKNSDKIKKLDTPLTEETYSIVVAKDDKEMLELVNEVLADLKSSGELQKIIDNYQDVLGAE